MKRWSSSPRPVWCSGAARPPMRLTPSSMRWCRTRPTTRCSRASALSCTPRSLRCWSSDFSERVANEPELLAHHFTQAGLNERAVPYWIKAGQRALARVALPEAVGHLTTALERQRAAAGLRRA